MELIAKTFQGLEDVLAGELKALGAEDVAVGTRMVSFTGDKAMLYKANFCCRTALRILKPIHTFSATDADELYEAAKHFDWEQLLSPEKTFAIDSVVYSEEFRHSRFVTYRVKDAIADFFMEKYGKRPSIRLNNADILLNVHIYNNEVTLSLDSSGESLHKRGYRVAQTEAPINEVLAAGLLLKAGWDGQCNLVDPMCGSGTFLIEAALIARNISPGVFRNDFAFERWADFDAELFESIYNDDSGEREFEHKIYGSDISPKAIAIAERNIKSAGVGKDIDLKVMSMQDYTEAPEAGILITNPPYGERIAVGDMEALYESIGERLKNAFQGYHAWIIAYKSEYFDKIGLKPSVKIPMLNGALECELREYVMFGGSYENFRRQGNSLRSDGEDDFDFDDRPPRRRKPFSDRREDRREDRRDRPFRRRDEDREDWREDRRDRPFRRRDDDRDDRREDRRDRPFRRRDDDRDDRREDRRDRPFRRRDDDRSGRFRGDRDFRRGDDDRWERDRRGVRRERAKNPLEEKYHKPYHERMRDERGGKPFRKENPADEVFADEKVRRAVRFKKPRLFDDAEMEEKEVVMRHRNRKEHTENE